jgi:hypothetical protein
MEGHKEGMEKHEVKEKETFGRKDQIVENGEQRVRHRGVDG